jgi:hypothetical protein
MPHNQRNTANSINPPDKVFNNNKGQIIGWVRGDTFYKEVLGSSHLMIKYDAWGIDKKVLDQIPTKKIRIRDKETGIIYATTAERFVEKGIRHDFGYGEQLFLPRDKFQAENSKQVKLL